MQFLRQFSIFMIIVILEKYDVQFDNFKPNDSHSSSHYHLHLVYTSPLVRGPYSRRVHRMASARNQCEQSTAQLHLLTQSHTATPSPSHDSRKAVYLSAKLPQAPPEIWVRNDTRALHPRSSSDQRSTQGRRVHQLIRLVQTCPSVVQFAPYQFHTMNK